MLAALGDRWRGLLELMFRGFSVGEAAWQRFDIRTTLHKLSQKQALTALTSAPAAEAPPLGRRLGPRQRRSGSGGAMAVAQWQWRQRAPPTPRAAHATIALLHYYYKRLYYTVLY